MNQKWFWATFSLLFLLSGGVIAWALISSPLKFDPQVISHFENDLNGQKQKTDIWVNPGRLTDLAPLVMKKMSDDNWEQISGDANLNTALLGPTAKDLDLSDQLQINVFKKDGIYRTIGLLQSKTTEATYGATSDIPKSAFDNNGTRKNWNLPIPPPHGQQLLFNLQLHNMKLGLILFSRTEEPFKEFTQTCSDMGYDLTLQKDEKDKKVFLIANKKNRILAIFSREGSSNSIALAQID